MNEGISLLVGIFVGGSSRRMGSPKGLLPAPDDSYAPRGLTLLERAAWVTEQAYPTAPRVLVGVRPEYAHSPLRALADSAIDSGPLGGLVALLQEGEKRRVDFVIALACDMPFVTPTLLRKLGAFEPEVDVVTPRATEFFEPLLARYKVSTQPYFSRALDERRLGLQSLLRGLHAATLPLRPEELEQVQDWDSPSDIRS
jgi:molybdopterin-guanine dinucleotide biosynthesis protein A